MPLSTPQNYTIKDIYALPEGERAKLIAGKMLYGGSAELFAPDALHGAFRHDPGPYPQQ
jgi:hypothetical protein